MIKIGKEDDYYYLSSKGLSHFKSGGSIMETIIDGSLNKIGLEGIWRYSMLIGDDKDYTILFKDDDVFELAHYEYDGNMPTVPGTQLTVYGLTKNKSVSRAIGTFQQENPDVRMNYLTAQGGEGASTTADSIRTLNTELLSGKGADILLLDGLPVDSYIEKGVLADISDVVGSMIDSGELLGNMTKGYEREDGGVYGIPVRFSIPILLGDKEINGAFSSLSSLRAYVQEHQENRFIRYGYRTATYDELAAFILLADYQEIIGDGSSLDKAKLIEFMETVRTAGDTIGATVVEEPIPPTTQEELESSAKARLEYYGIAPRFAIGELPVYDGMVSGCEIRGIWDMMGPVGMQEQYKRTITPANSLYIPTGIVGVNSASGEIDKAKDFVRCILSEQEQAKDLGDGMPVNSRALESYCSKESESSVGMNMNLDGKEIRLRFGWPAKLPAGSGEYRVPSGGL